MVNHEKALEGSASLVHRRSSSVGAKKRSENPYQDFKDQFMISTLDRQYNFFCSSRAECQHWVRVLKLAMVLAAHEAPANINVYDFERWMEERERARNFADKEAELGLEKG